MDPRPKCKVYNIQRKTHDLGLGGGFLRYDTKNTSNNDKIDKRLHQNCKFDNGPTPPRK